MKATFLCVGGRNTLSDELTVDTIRALFKASACTCSVYSIVCSDEDKR